MAATARWADRAMVKAYTLVAGKCPALGEWIRFELMKRRAALKQPSAVSKDTIAKVKAQKKRLKELGIVYTHMPAVSFVVASHNQGWSAAMMSEALVGLHGVAAEAVVCEDGSADESMETYSGKLIYPNHFVIHCNGLGAARGLDRAVRCCRGAVVCIVDAEDALPSAGAFVERALELFKRYPNLAVLGGARRYKLNAAAKQLDVVEETTRSLDFVAAVAGGPVFIRAAAYASAGGFDAATGAAGGTNVGFVEEFCLRCWVNGWQVAHEPVAWAARMPRNVPLAGAGGRALYVPAEEVAKAAAHARAVIAAAYGTHFAGVANAVQAANAAR